MPLLIDLMKQYNVTLQRIEKAMKFLDDPTVPEDKKEHWQPEFKKLAEQMNSLVLQINNYEMSAEEILKGFEV